MYAMYSVPAGAATVSVDFTFPFTLASAGWSELLVGSSATTTKTSVGAFHLGQLESHAPGADAQGPALLLLIHDSASQQGSFGNGHHIARYQNIRVHLEGQGKSLLSIRGNIPSQGDTETRSVGDRDRSHPLRGGRILSGVGRCGWSRGWLGLRRRLRGLRSWGDRRGRSGNRRLWRGRSRRSVHWSRRRLDRRGLLGRRMRWGRRVPLRDFLRSRLLGIAHHLDNAVVDSRFRQANQFGWSEYEVRGLGRPDLRDDLIVGYLSLDHLENMVVAHGRVRVHGHRRRFLGGWRLRRGGSCRFGRGGLLDRRRGLEL